MTGYSNVVRKITTKSNKIFVLRVTIVKTKDPFKKQELEIMKLLKRLPIYYNDQLSIHHYIPNELFKSEQIEDELILHKLILEIANYNSTLTFKKGKAWVFDLLEQKGKEIWDKIEINLNEIGEEKKLKLQKCYEDIE